MNGGRVRQRFRDVSIARKLYITVGAMMLLIGVELISLFFCLNTLSSVRAYVGGEGLWSKAQKDAVFHLYRYGVSGDAEDYRLFKQFMEVPNGDGEARQELFKPHPNLRTARHGLLSGRNSPDDVEGMIELFQRFSEMPYIKKAFAIWGEAEPLALELISIADKLHDEITSETPSHENIDRLLASIGPANEKLTTLEDEFSYTLGAGSRWLEKVVFRLLFSVALTVEITGLLLTISVSRTLQRGLKEIIRTASAFAEGRYDARANWCSRDEIGLLANSFDLMAERLEQSFIALRSEIDRRERAQMELRQAFALLNQHVNNTPLGVIEWLQNAADGGPPRVHRWSGRATAIFGWTQDEVVGRSANDLGLFDSPDASLIRGRQHLPETDNAYDRLSIRCRTKERRVCYCRWYNSELPDPSGHKITILSLVEDVTEQVTALENIYRLAHHDALTGLPNRVLLQDRLRHALSHARRCGLRVAVMMLDLDRFKVINDTLGHTLGDELLQQVAARLGGRLQTSDTIARLGGDEFILIQGNAMDRGRAMSMAQNLLDTFTEPFIVRDHRLDIGVCIGLAMFPDDAPDADELLRNADIALYRAKRDGRRQHRSYSAEMDWELKASHLLETGLRQALEGGVLELFYQPIYSLNNGCMEGVEALCRWPRADGSYVAPASFIPIAEASGLIVPLGEWALRQACTQARVWREKGRQVRVAVNISAVQLRQPDFVQLVTSVLGSCGLAASDLELEITEGVFLDPSTAVITKALQNVAEMGVRLAIDDFGTGFSNLGYLKHFPFDRIKIDQSFVHDIGGGANADAIVSGIIALAHSLGKQVTAEGVETEFQLGFLQDRMCDEAQGHFLARPTWATDIEHMFATNLYHDSHRQPLEARVTGDQAMSETVRLLPRL